MDRLPILADLRETEQGVDIWCCNHDCRHEVYWPIEVAEARLGAHRTFAEMTEVLKCSGCDARGRDDMVRIRGSMKDYYAHLLRKRWTREEAKYGYRVSQSMETGPYVPIPPTGTAG